MISSIAAFSPVAVLQACLAGGIAGVAGQVVGAQRLAQPLVDIVAGTGDVDVAVRCLEHTGTATNRQCSYR